MKDLGGAVKVAPALSSLCGGMVDANDSKLRLAYKNKPKPCKTNGIIKVETPKKTYTNLTHFGVFTMPVESHLLMYGGASRLSIRSPRTAATVSR